MVCKVDYLHPASYWTLLIYTNICPSMTMKRECRQWFTQESTRCNHWKCVTVPLVLEVLMIIQRNICYFTSGGKKKGICVTRLCTKMYIFVSKNPIYWLSQIFRWCTLADVLPKSKELYWFIVTSCIICRGETEKYGQKPLSPTPAPHCGVCHLPDHSGTFRLLEHHFSHRIPRSPGWQRLTDNLQHTLNDRAVQQGCAPRNVFS